MGASRGVCAPSETKIGQHPRENHTSAAVAGRALQAAGRTERAHGGPAAPPQPRLPPQAALTQAAPAQRAVAAVQDCAQLAQQRGRQVEQGRVHRERAAGSAAPSHRRPGHGTAAGHPGPGEGMRSSGLSTSPRAAVTQPRKSCFHDVAQDSRTRRAQALEGAGPT